MLLWGVLSAIFTVFVIIFMFVVLQRLRAIEAETRRTAEHLIAIRFPHLPWPKPSADTIMTTMEIRGHTYRLLGDGQWQRRGFAGVWTQVDNPGDRGPGWS